MAGVFKQEIKPAKDLLPDGVKAAKEFQAGKGDAIGKVKAVAGTGLVIHKNGTEAYPLKKGVDLYMGDTIITGGGSNVQAALNDKSTISIAGFTKLVIDKSTYDPKTSKRDSILSLIFGKARFLVSKVAEGKEDYFVKSPTAIVGVRGSDFAVSVAPSDKVAGVGAKWWQWLSSLFQAKPAFAAATESPLTTTVATGKETTVSFTGDVGPTQVVGPNMISKAVAGMAATIPLALSAAVVVGALGGAGVAAAGVSTAAIVGLGVAAAAVGVAAAASNSGGDDDGINLPPPVLPPPGGGTPCDSLTTSGGNAPESHTVELGQTSGTFDFSWEMYSIKDQMVVKYQGTTLFDTGCVSNSGTQAISYSGSSSEVTVDAIPNCDGTSGTSWNFTVSCPK